jgi:pimeloyl-ACP methyl ester carboxylesterase
MKPSASEYLEIRGVRYHLRTWGSPGAPPVFLLHGWMDASASFQFMVDALATDWRVFAPDWRGFGLSGWAAGVYWFQDYLADLDALLETLSPHVPVNLVGHSLGGNVACIYAGVRPERVRRVATLEGFGIPRSRAEQAPGRYAQWLEELRRSPEFKRYASFEALAARLRKQNPRLTPERAAFVARHWARETGEGEVELLGDPGHKLVNPVLYRLEETLACWRAVRAPVLWVEGAESEFKGWIRDTPEQWTERKAALADLREAVITGAGHMLHHDQPEATARVVEAFLTEAP